VILGPVRDADRGSRAPRAPGNFPAEYAADVLLAVGSLLRYSSGLGAKPQRRP
jgi:hypothetical protein